MSQGRADSAQAERRVFLARQRLIVERLVATYVHQSQYQRFAAERVRNALVHAELLVFGRRRVAIYEKKLRAKQAAAFGTRSHCRGCFRHASEIREYLDARPIACAALEL